MSSRPHAPAEQHVPSAGPSELGGELLDAPANRPFRLEGAGSAWLVEQGGLDVFLTEERGEGDSSWQHLLRADEGRVVLGVPGDAPLGVLARGLPGTRLRRLGIDDLIRLVRAEELAVLIDAWVRDVADAVGGQIEPRPFIDAVASAGRPLSLEGPSVISGPVAGVIWCEAPGDAVYLGTESLGDGASGLVALTSQTWLALGPAADAGALSTAGIIRDGRLLRALSDFHRLVFSAESVNRRLALADDVNEVLGRSAHQQRAQASARLGLFSVLGSARSPHEGDDLVLMAALRAVGAHEGIDFRMPPHARAAPGDGVALDDILQASGVRSRRVRLAAADRWWRSDSGALLGERREDGRPVALLPRGVRGYRVADPSGTRAVPMNARRAELIGESAWMFYRPLPRGRSLGWGELARFAARNTLGDWAAFFIASLLSTAALVLPGVLVGQLADRVLPSADSSGLADIVVALSLLAVFAALLLSFGGIMLLRIEGRAAAETGAAVMDRLLDLPIGFFRRYSVGDLASRMDTIWRVRDQVIGVVATTMARTVFIVPSLGLLFWYDASLALTTLAIGAVAVAVICWTGLKMISPQRQRLAAVRSVAGKLLQYIGGIAKLRAAGATGTAFAAWAGDYREQLEARMQVDDLQRRLVALNAAVPAFATAALFALALNSNLDDLTAGSFLVVHAVSMTFFFTVGSLAAAFETAASAVPLVEQIKPILDEAPEQRPPAAIQSPLRGMLHFDRVSFHYHADDPPVLDEVSIHAQPGEFVAIVGESGSGKTTLMRLALGLHQPASGAVLYDGNDLAHLSAAAVRRQIGVVAQDGSLQPGNLAENIIGLDNDLTFDDAWRAARLADIADEIEAMPMQMFTAVGDSMTMFSGGQMQRIRIAAAVVRNPRILLLDEATSWLDTASQARVMSAIEGLTATRLVIAHRLSTVRAADRIYVMQHGRVAQHGTFEELYGTDGAFRELMDRQLI